jgi:hypothetical protein
MKNPTEHFRKTKKISICWKVKTQCIHEVRWNIYRHFHHLSTIKSKGRVSLVEQELLTLPEQLSSPPVFSGVHVTRSLVLCVCFVDHCLSFCPFSFGHCVVCSSSIYDSVFFVSHCIFCPLNYSLELITPLVSSHLFLHNASIVMTCFITMLTTLYEWGTTYMSDKSKSALSKQHRLSNFIILIIVILDIYL